MVVTVSKGNGYDFNLGTERTNTENALATLIMLNDTIHSFLGRLRDMMASLTVSALMKKVRNYFNSENVSECMQDLYLNCIRLARLGACLECRRIAGCAYRTLSQFLGKSC